MVFSHVVGRLIGAQGLRNASVPRMSQRMTIQRRGMGGAANAGPRPKEYGGFRPPHVNQTYKAVGNGMLTIMWLWIFYRAKQDGKFVLGIEHPWDAHGDHGHGHGDDHFEWEKPGIGEKMVLVESEHHH